MAALVPQLETRRPTIFTTQALLSVSLYGLILAVPVLISMMVVSVVQFGMITFLVPCLTIAITLFFLPLGFGNPCIARLVRPLQPNPQVHQELYVVQLTRTPRSRSGLLAILEDADDIGFLNFADSILIFSGDSFHLSVPYDKIKDFKLRNAGWRALFLYGAPITFSVVNLPEEGSFTFVERSSCVLPTSRRTARKMYLHLRERIQAAASSAAVGSDQP